MSALRTVVLAGLRIVWQPWEENDPVSAILSCLYDASPPASASQPSLHLQLDHALDAPSPRPGEDHRALFFHGRTQAFASDRELVLWDGASRLAISHNGTRIDGAVHPDSLSDGHTFAHATLLIALAVALRLRGRFHLHGGLVALPELGTVLVAGDAAHGKSTTTLSLLSRGGLLAGDDTLYLDPDARCIWGLPKPLNLSPRTAASFSSLTAAVPTPTPAESGKRSYPARMLFPGAVAPSLTYPDWLLFPRITGEPTTRLAPVAATDALGGLMTASALVAVDNLAGSEAHLTALLGLATSGRAYELLLGTDALERPALILDLLAAEKQATR